MSYTCYICKEIVAGGVRGLFLHLRSVHFVCEVRNVILKCGQGDCIRSYSTFNSLAHHLRSQHSSQDLLTSCVPAVADSEPCDTQESLIPVSSASGGASCSAVRDGSTAAAGFLASLLTSSAVTEKTVQSVVENATSFVSDIVQGISDDVRNTLGSANIVNNAVCDNLLDRIQQYGRPFEAVNTQYKRKTYFRRQYGMVEARSVFLGNRYYQSINAATGNMRPIIKRDTFQYVPILQLIALMLSDRSVLNETLQDHRSNDGKMRDFCDGSLYSSNALFAHDRTSLQVCLYYDECEVVNPLGSRRGIHKIGFIYMCLRNLSPVYNSCLDNIHIVAAFNSIDRTKYGFDRILAPLVSDLQQLEQGVDLVLRDGTVVHRRGTVIYIAGDNLGLNQLCGFVESFSALHFCRLCTVSRQDCCEIFRDDRLELRNKDQYSHQLKSVLEGTVTTRDCGIKSSCLLNNLEYFHVVDNASVDIMHDLLEGVVPFELKLILFAFVFCRKYFSLQLLNARLASFDYGFSDRRNKPTAISEAELRDEQKTALNQKAAQVLCLVKILPVLIGDKVPLCDQMWHLYLMLRDIIDLVFADSCTVGDSIYLKHLIEDHHSLFRAVFPDRNMLPNHHLLVHYPSVMRKVGPLSRCSSIRFEAKHYESKRLCSIVCCFKDICKTVVRRHQLSQSVRLAAGNSAVYRVSVDKVSVCTVNELPQSECEAVLSSVAGLNRFDDISHADVVNVCGTEYRKHMVVVVGRDDEPDFRRIVRCVLVADDIVYFLCRDLHVKYYDRHLHAYAVEQGDGVHAVAHRCLQYYRPLCSHRTFNSSILEYVAFE